MPKKTYVSPAVFVCGYIVKDRQNRGFFPVYIHENIELC